MARRYRRRHRYTVARPLKTTKYSNETYTSAFNMIAEDVPVGTHATFSIPIIPQAMGGVLGTRKAKNFTLRICPEATLIEQKVGGNTFERSRVAFALVFVPEGTLPSAIKFGANTSAASLYEPNQNVILSGLVDSTQTYTFKTRLARNINSGDTIALVLYDLISLTADWNSTNTPIAFTCNYAISF